MVFFHGTAPYKKGRGLTWESSSSSSHWLIPFFLFFFCSFLSPGDMEGEWFGNGTCLYSFNIDGLNKARGTWSTEKQRSEPCDWADKSKKVLVFAAEKVALNLAVPSEKGKKTPPRTDRSANKVDKKVFLVCVMQFCAFCEIYREVGIFSSTSLTWHHHKLCLLLYYSITEAWTL